MSVRRIQLRRVKGWRMPVGTVKCDRTGPFGNPYLVTEDQTAEQAVARFREWAEAETVEFAPSRHARFRAELPFLRGRNLGCWCSLCERHRWGRPAAEPCDECRPCHVDVLIELANR